MSRPDNIAQRVNELSPLAFAALVGLLEKRGLVGKSDASARLTAFVSASNSGTPLGETNLQDHLASQLPDYMQPAAWAFVETIPRTSNGKVDKVHLVARQRVLSLQGGSGRVATDSSDEKTAAQSDIATQLLTIWQDVLGMDEVLQEDDYFELGGDSISAMQIVARASKLDLEFTTRELMQSSTVARLAHRLAQHITTEGDSSADDLDAGEDADTDLEDVDDVLRVLNLGRD